MSAGRPAAIEMVADFEEALITAISDGPLRNLIARVPPPPQPSFFMVMVRLKEGERNDSQSRNME